MQLVVTISLLGKVPPTTVRETVLARELLGGPDGPKARDREGGFSRGKVEGAAMKHGDGQACHDRLSLYVDTSEEFIQSPPVDEPNAVRIDPGAKKGHGAAGASRTRRNRGGRNGRVGVNGQSDS